MSSFEAEVAVDAGGNTGAIFDSISTDNDFYPENPTRTRMSMDGGITVRVESDHLPHLRANLNSLLRLIQASHDSIESVRATRAPE